MANLFTKITDENTKVEVEKIKISLSFDKNKIEKFEALKTQMESRMYKVLSLNQYFEKHLNASILRMAKALEEADKSDKHAKSDNSTESNKSVDSFDSANSDNPANQNDAIWCFCILRDVFLLHKNYLPHFVRHPHAGVVKHKNIKNVNIFAPINGLSKNIKTIRI